jgi:hypothetical protein
MGNIYLNQGDINSSFTLDRVIQRKLLRIFWIIVAGLFCYELFFATPSSFLSNCGAILITTAALLPIYLWCSGRALGLPIFPLFSLTFIWTYALPLVTDYPGIIKYPPEQHLAASLIIFMSLVLATYIWYQFVRCSPPMPTSYRSLSASKGDQFFLFCLGLGVVFNIYLLGGWFLLDGGAFIIFRGAIFGVNALSIFALAYRLGTKELTRRQSQLFLLLFPTFMIVNSASFLLVGTTSMFVIAVAAFSLGSKKIPLKSVMIVIFCLSFLHYGKAEMRGKYWYNGQPTFFQPWQYPTLYAEWVGYSIDYLSSQKDSNSHKSEEKESFLERSSVIQIFLLAQSKSPETIPYLNGATYATLPELMIPRFLNSNKIASHEGTFLLNIHYGLQNREATNTTTLAWGLLAESYANFGELGCAGLAVILGIIYGQTTKWTINAPLLSDRSLLGIVMISVAFQAEYNAGMFLTTVCQSVVVIGVMAFVLMKPYPTIRKQFVNQ